MISFGLAALLFLAGMTVIAAWVFRTTAAPLWAKMAVPSVLMALAFFGPKTVNGLLGSPMVVECEGLPASFEIIAFSVPREDAADLFVSPGPRLYEIQVDEEMKATLTDLRLKLVRGPVRITRNCEAGKASPRKADNGGGNGGHKGENVFQEDAPPLAKERDE